MFDLISREDDAVPQQDAVPLLISIAVHLVMIGAVAAIPLLYVSAELPRVPAILAFVATAAPPPPPPPPPPAVKATIRPKPVPKPLPSLAPVEAPAEIAPRRSDIEAETEEGIPGGVEGGVPGGILGGVVGGSVTQDVVPPPPPPPPVARAPVRVGGAIMVPALVSRIAPVYPPLAVKARVQGVVVLEAVVDRNGRVESVTVLRSILLLDRAAIEAVRQWRYSPLLLNGQPERFVLAVTVNFSLKV